MGIANWFKKKGKDSVEYAKDNVNYREINETGRNIKDMSKAILSPKEAIENSRKETFREAAKRLGVSEIQLIQNYKNYAYIVYISLFFSLVCFLGASYYLFIEKSVISALSMISIMLFCLANTFKFSFRAFQIKHQKLCSAKEWWERANEWLPKI